MLTYYAYDSITVNGKEVPKATDMTLEKAWTVLTFKKEVSSERTLKALKIEENGKKVPIFIAKERVGKMLLKSQFNTCFEDAETVTIGFNVAADGIFLIIASNSIVSDEIWRYTVSGSLGRPLCLFSHLQYSPFGLFMVF